MDLGDIDEDTPHGMSDALLAAAPLGDKGGCSSKGTLESRVSKASIMLGLKYADGDGTGFVQSSGC